MARETAGQTTVGRIGNMISALPPDWTGEAEQRQAALLLLDTIGCALAGWHEHSAASVAGVTEALGGAPSCQIIGAPWRTSIPNAVLANGALVRVLDLNDYVLRSSNGETRLGGHPSDNIVVALAFGEQMRSSGRAVLDAIAIGYELFGRARAASPDSPEWDGVSGSGLVAPAIGARLMGLDGEQSAHAIAISLARCATSAMVRAGDLSAAKSIANAMVARTGAEAVLLAAAGITGPLAILDHARGMTSVFGTAQTRPDLAAPPAPPGYIMQARIKPFACVATAQCAVEAALRLAGQRRVKPGEIQSLRLTMADHPTIRRHLSDRNRADPTSKEAADHSIPFLTAVALIDGTLGEAQFENARWQAADARAVMGLLTVGTDTALAARAPGQYAARLELTSNSGETRTVEVLRPPGNAPDGLEAEAVIAKFHRTAAARLAESARSRVVDAALGLPTAPDLDGLVRAMAASG